MNAAAVIAAHEFVSARARYARAEAVEARAALDLLDPRAAGAAEAWLRWSTAEAHARRCADAYVESLADVAGLDLVVDVR